MSSCKVKRTYRKLLPFGFVATIVLQFYVQVKGSFRAVVLAAGRVGALKTLQKLQATYSLLTLDFHGSATVVLLPLLVSGLDLRLIVLHEVAAVQQGRGWLLVLQLPLLQMLRENIRPVFLDDLLDDPFVVEVTCPQNFLEA